MGPTPPHSSPDVVELICQNARKTRQNEAIALWTLLSPKPEWFLMKVPPKNIFGHFCMFGLVKGHFGLLGPKNGPPSGQTATYRKTEGIQSYLRIWRRYDPIELGPSEPNKGGLCGCSVKKSRILSQKWALGPAQMPSIQRCQHKQVFFLVFGHDGSCIFGWHLQNM